MKVRKKSKAVKVNPKWKIGIVASEFYPKEMMSLIKGAHDTLLKAGIKEKNIVIHRIPGSFEIPLIGAALAKKKKVHALIGIGIVVKGETKHADLIAKEAARGMMDVQVTYRIPFACEVLLVSSLKQAQDRTKGAANKGREAATTVLQSLAKLSHL